MKNKLEILGNPNLQINESTNQNSTNQPVKKYNMDAEELKKRTKQFYFDVLFFMRTIKSTDEVRDIKRQLGRSASSVAANYRAACRSRSNKEFYAKLCIVVEESDESLFWLEVINETQESDKSKLEILLIEGQEILNIMSRSRKTLGDRLFNEKPNS